MCGIAGFAGLSDLELLKGMTESVRHRGPDESGYFHEDGVGLGSRRLSIIDLSTGRQPISGETGAVVVFNGEIYNFAALRDELIAKGHPFKTHTDTEVIVHLYEQEGLEGIARLSGMFAFALWDQKRKRLVVARDGVGIKPLYYASHGSKFYFGSELKALRRVPGLTFELKSASLDHFLNYLYIPAPDTIYENVFKLKPGQWLTWQDGRLERGVFWRPKPSKSNLSRLDARVELDCILEKAIRAQLVADVPVGLFLSGGLDSSALAYYVAKGSNCPEAFCASYSSGDESFNELPKARQIADYFGLTLHELRIEPEVEQSVGALVEAFDEPMGDSSALPTYWISRQARKNVKVALTGVGGDEVFGGYPRYLGARMFGAYSAMPAAARRVFSLAAQHVPETVSSRDIGSWFRRFLSYGGGSARQAYAGWTGHLSPTDRSALYAPALAQAVPYSAPYDAFENGEDLLKEIMRVDLETYLPEDLLTLADRTSMAVGLELRVPFCDERLVEFALSLPSSYRVRGFTLKSLFKELLARKLPPKILAQKKKGFMVPIGNWFQQELKPFLGDSIASLERRGLFRGEGLRQMMNEHLSGRRNRTDLLWSLVFLERWFQRFHPDYRAG